MDPTHGRRWRLLLIRGDTKAAGTHHRRGNACWPGAVAVVNETGKWQDKMISWCLAALLMMIKLIIEFSVRYIVDIFTALFYHIVLYIFKNGTSQHFRVSPFDPSNFSVKGSL
jgi:hypothetical protein